jgi:hypothetical protein
VDSKRNHIGIYDDAGADDAAHDDHGGIEHAQQAAGFGSSQASRLSP